MSLMLHCGASEVGLHELKDIPITDRVHRWIGKDGQPRVLERSDKWAGIQHYDFADAVIGACYDMGMPIDQSRSKWGVSENGADLFGCMKFQTEVEGRPTVIAKYFTDEVEPTMGLRHSNTSRFAAKATIGGGCFVCDNLIITGEVAFNKKHTTGNVASIKVIIGDGLIKYLDAMPTVNELVRDLQHKYISQAELADTYLRAARTKLMPWSHIGEVDKYWVTPTHDTFAKQENGWRLYNAFNTVAKKYNPTRQFDVIGKLHNVILPQEEGLYASNT